MKFRPITVGSFIKFRSALFLGQIYPLDLFENCEGSGNCLFKSGRIRLYVQRSDSAKLALKKFYINQALELLHPYIQHYARACCASPAGVVIVDRHKYWGSCTKNGLIKLNWRLIMLPLGMSEYVVAHEICHLVHLEHSKNFWRLIGNVLPNYKLRKVWLKTQDHLLLPQYRS